MPKDKKTETRVIEAATEVFIQKGWSGARTQEIADKANINKAMLHYYFGSKEQLFAIVFENKIQQFIRPLLLILESESSFEEKVRTFVNMQTDFIAENPKLPLFIFNEIARHPELKKHIPMTLILPIIENFSASIKEEVQKGKIKQINVAEFMINMLSLVMYPFIAKPVIGHLLNIPENAYKDFLQVRKESVIDLLLKSLKP